MAVIVAREGYKDVLLHVENPSINRDLGPQILAMLEPGGECVVYEAFRDYDAMNMLDVWRRGHRVGVLSKEDPTKRTYKRRLVR